MNQRFGLNRTVRLPSRTQALRTTLTVLGVLAFSTVVVAILEGPLVGLSDASPVYFVAVVIAGSRIGTGPAIATAFGSFLVYDLLFTKPQLTLIVSDAREWLDLVLFLVLAVVVGRLSSIGVERAREASRMAAESTALFDVSRILATAPDSATAAPLVARRLLADGPLDRVWIIRERPGSSRLIADTTDGQPLPASSFVTSLTRTLGDGPARWVQAHVPLPVDGRTARSARSAGSAATVRVRLEADGVVIGSLQATLGDGLREPDRVTTRLLALAADQLALTIRRDDLRREATEAEIARRADSLKTALLDAVSHDLRTPLASIRAAAGSLADPEVVVDAAAARVTAAAIDAEADRLDRLVREVLDLSRIEAGSLRPELEPLVLADAVAAVVERLRPILGERPIRVAISDDLPPVRADAVLLDGLVANLVENVARHVPEPAPLEITAAAAGSRVRLVVEDGGPGISVDRRERVFEKFQAGPTQAQGSRPGLGLGLAIVRGMTEAMGGTVEAGSSELGGLRITVELAAAEGIPAEATAP